MKLNGVWRKKSQRKKFLAGGEGRMAILWPAPGCNGGTVADGTLIFAPVVSHCGGKGKGPIHDTRPQDVDEEAHSSCTPTHTETWTRTHTLLMAPSPMIQTTVSCWPMSYFGHCNASSPQWGAADAEIKVPSGENTELKRSPFNAWSRSVYSHTC